MKTRDRVTRISPLLMHVVCAAIVVFPLLAGDLSRFEEASVKRAEMCSMRNSVDPARISLIGDPLKVILMEAFQVKIDEVVGPSWLDAECYSIVAKLPEGATRDQIPAMLRVLLAERFQLASHKETRQRAGYALTVDKKGPKLKASEAGSPIRGLGAGQVRFGAAAEAAGIKGSMTMAALARYLSHRLNVPVEDLTGINGKFDIDVSWTPDVALEKTGPFAQAASASLSSGDAASLPAGTGSVFTSLRETLGLRLEPRKEQIEVVVIDHSERVPAEN